MHRRAVVVVFGVLALGLGFASSLQAGQGSCKGTVTVYPGNPTSGGGISCSGVCTPPESSGNCNIRQTNTPSGNIKYCSCNGSGTTGTPPVCCYEALAYSTVTGGYYSVNGGWCYDELINPDCPEGTCHEVIVSGVYPPQDPDDPVVYEATCPET